MKHYVPPPGSIGYISITNATHVNQRSIGTKSKFFVPNEEIIVDVKWDKIVFRKPDFSYTGKTHKMVSLKNGWVFFSIVADLPLGKFEFDPDESNMDEMVVYLQ